MIAYGRSRKASELVRLCRGLQWKGKHGVSSCITLLPLQGISLEESPALQQCEAQCAICQSARTYDLVYLLNHVRQSGPWFDCELSALQQQCLQPRPSLPPVPQHQPPCRRS